MIAQPLVIPCPAENRYLLISTWNVSLFGRRFTVPCGFQYDGASIPSLAWRVTYTPFHPDVMAAALLHDWIYREGLTDRRHADDLFLRLLHLSGAGRMRARVMWAGVRIGGWVAWNRHRKTEE